MIDEVQQELMGGLLAMPRLIVWVGDETWTAPPKTAPPAAPAGFVELDLDSGLLRPTFSRGRLEGWTLVADVFVQLGTDRQTLGARVMELLQHLAAIPRGALSVIDQLAEEGELIERGETGEWIGRRIRVPLFWATSAPAPASGGDEP